MIDETYDITELEKEANRRIAALRPQYSAVKKINGPRNIHYYASKELLEPPGRRDGKAFYSRTTLNRLIFIRLLQARKVWNLDQIRQVFDVVPAEQVARIVEGKEPLEVVTWSPDPKQRKPAGTEAPSIIGAIDADESRRLSESFDKTPKDFTQCVPDAQLWESNDLRRRGMSSPGEIEFEVPELLQTVSGAKIASAISAAYLATTKLKLEARVLQVDYTGRIGLSGPFRRFAEIGFSLYSADAADTGDELFEALNNTSDETIANAIASGIGKLAGEVYQGFIARKRLGSGRKPNSEVANVRIQLAKVADGKFI
jgi:DNA-binding transcriptional MerR regulator